MVNGVRYWHLAPVLCREGVREPAETKHLTPYCGKKTEAWFQGSSVGI